VELPDDIFKVGDLLVRPPRTIPENQEVAEEEGDFGDLIEFEGVIEGFIALSSEHGHCIED
jgi:hypothetical protein